jgi:hypothetical protein
LQDWGVLLGVRSLLGLAESVVFLCGLIWP